MRKNGVTCTARAALFGDPNPLSQRLTARRQFAGAQCCLKRRHNSPEKSPAAGKGTRAHKGRQ
jgi:hypothetical protein